MSCFICDLMAPETHKIFETMTSYRGIPLYNVLYDFMSKYFDVKIDGGDIVCDTCSALLNAMDRFRCELEIVEHMLQLQITRKYKLNESQVVRLNDRTAKHFHKGTRKLFACVECPFETDFADCLMPHCWLHEHQTEFLKSSSSAVVDISLGRNVCHSCKLRLSTDETLEAHLLEFHDDDAESDPMNDTSPVLLEIDAESEINDGSDHDEAVAFNETKENVMEDSLQCEVC